tara:strand:+ start:142 stop:708 length:567 start_codon:yes stop_codon:yes gene_type:complete
MFHKKRKTIKYKNRNKKNKYTHKKKKTKKTKKQKGGGENKNKKILDYINQINIDLKNKCKSYESIKDNKEKYIQYCNKTTVNIGEKTLPLCYIDSKKNEKGNIYNCNSINEGNDFQKIQNFHTGIKQSQYTYDHSNKNKIITNNSSNNTNNRKSLLSSIYHLFDGYNPLILRKKIKELKEIVSNLDKR